MELYGTKVEKHIILCFYSIVEIISLFQRKIAAIIFMKSFTLYLKLQK